MLVFCIRLNIIYMTMQEEEMYIYIYQYIMPELPRRIPLYKHHSYIEGDADNFAKVKSNGVSTSRYFSEKGVIFFDYPLISFWLLFTAALFIHVCLPKSR